MSMEQLTFLSAEPHAKDSQSQDCEADWVMRVLAWPSDFSSLLMQSGPLGCCGRTSLGSTLPLATTRRRRFRITTITARETSAKKSKRTTLKKGRTSANSLPHFLNSGTVSLGEPLTLNTSEWPSAAAVCSLSDILETGDVPRRYFLSATACAGILRRAAKRDRELPTQLREALEAVVSAASESETVEDKTP